MASHTVNNIKPAPRPRQADSPPSVGAAGCRRLARPSAICCNRAVLEAEKIGEQPADGGRPPLVAVIMGSKSDWNTMGCAVGELRAAGVACETRIVSAHRTPELLFEFARGAVGRGLRCIIAGAGGAAHLPGMTAALTRLPVLGVPVRSRALDGLDSLLSIAQMPFGVPVATFAPGERGARAAARFATRLVDPAQPHPQR